VFQFFLVKMAFAPLRLSQGEEVQVTLGHIEARKARDIHCNQ